MDDETAQIIAILRTSHEDDPPLSLANRCHVAANELEWLAREHDRWQRVAELFGQAFAAEGSERGVSPPDIEHALLAYEQARREVAADPARGPAVEHEHTSWGTYVNERRR